MKDINVSLIENNLENQQHLINFIRFDKLDKIVYLYGKNAYSRLFIKKYKIHIAGYISDDNKQNTYYSYPVINTHDFIKKVEEYQKYIIICFVEDFAKINFFLFQKVLVPLVIFRMDYFFR